MVRQGAARGGAPGGGPGGRGHIGGRSVGAAVGGGGRRVRGRDAARGWRRRLGPAAPPVQWWQRRGQCGAGAARGRRPLSPPPARRLRDGVQAAAVWRVGRLAAQARCGHERRAAADRRAGPGVRGGGRLVGPARGDPPTPLPLGKRRGAAIRPAAPLARLALHLCRPRGAAAAAAAARVSGGWRRLARRRALRLGRRPRGAARRDRAAGARFPR
mmetsp:Transcript_7536/g.22327  ORF Transcript_7536/g.22327 Transcript_7536/m.22327 type:complete len:215 (-) Transcript_7536:1470-2114(-)